ncbi:hypothetical protein HYT92_01510 [Candidatus Pacearchaeota archaeon]|nr:hypothetical protein [Candidatus Pacearchaeota archaeon]
MKNLTPAFAEIIGLLCAEGSHIISYSNYWGTDRGRKRFYKNDKSERIEISNKDKLLLLHYSQLLLKEFNYVAKSTKHYKVNICKMSIIKEIIGCTELGHTKWKVPDFIIQSGNEVKVAFIRGYFDGDGTVSNSIRMFSTNNSGLNQVSKLLQDLGFKPYFEKPMIKENRKPLYVIHIRQKERERFLSLIKPVSKRPGNLRG